jgi:anti-anti-sigma factor
VSGPHLSITIDFCDAVPEVILEGFIDHSTAPALTRVLDCVARAGFPEAYLDLAGVDFLDSSALSAFAAARERACQLTFWNVPPLARRLLELDERHAHVHRGLDRFGRDHAVAEGGLGSSGDEWSRP